MLMAIVIWCRGFKVALNIIIGVKLTSVCVGGVATASFLTLLNVGHEVNRGRAMCEPHVARATHDLSRRSVIFI